jgi:hypothetical protein
MARAPSSSIFELTDTQLRAGFGGRTAIMAVHEGEDEEGEPVLIVEIDMLEVWEDGTEIEMDDLQRLFTLIERECDQRGIEVEFE